MELKPPSGEHSHWCPICSKAWEGCRCWMEAYPQLLCDDCFWEDSEGRNSGDKETCIKAEEG